MPNLIKPRKHVSFDPLMQVIRDGAERLPDHRGEDVDYSIADAVMSAVALFSLKDPSLLAFQERRNDHNMKKLFRIQQVPSDTRMREILDPVQPDLLRPLFDGVFRNLQRGAGLKPFVFHQDCYLLSMDGTESGIIHEAGFWWSRSQWMGRYFFGGGRERVVPPFPRGFVAWRYGMKSIGRHNGRRELNLAGPTRGAREMAAERIAADSIRSVSPIEARGGVEQSAGS
jgi:hypothetical protein